MWWATSAAADDPWRSAAAARDRGDRSIRTQSWPDQALEPVGQRLEQQLVVDVELQPAARASSTSSTATRGRAGVGPPSASAAPVSRLVRSTFQTVSPAPRRPGSPGRASTGRGELEGEVDRAPWGPALGALQTRGAYSRLDPLLLALGRVLEVGGQRLLNLLAGGAAALGGRAARATARHRRTGLTGDGPLGAGEALGLGPQRCTVPEPPSARASSASPRERRAHARADTGRRRRPRVWNRGRRRRPRSRAGRSARAGSDERSSAAPY